MADTLSPRPLRRRRLAILVAALAAVTALACWGAYRWAEAGARAALTLNGDQRLGLYASSIRNAVGRYDYLPFLVARDHEVLDLLDAPSTLGRDAVNRRLETANAAAGSAALYVVDRGGLALASSNWADPAQSFVGQRYDFRPYFRQAVETGSGRYFGIGVTTGLPGYFLSHAVRRGEALIGVAVVKIDLEPIQRDWAAGGERVLVTDENGIVFLSSHADWKYRALRQLPDAVTARLAQTRQYDRSDLTPLGLHDGPLMENGARLVGLPASGPTRRAYLMQELALPEFGWTIRFLSDLEPVKAEAAGAAVLTAMGILLLAAAAALGWQRRQTLRLQHEARVTLERRVEERTAELLTANRILREAQEELVQAGKLAALGQMSAALAHEINQPLAAIRTFVASTRLLAERGETAMVRDNLAMISDLAERMALLSGHLKEFARKGPARVEAVPVARAMDRALALLASRLREEEVQVDRSIPPDARVRGDAVRLEQVFVNLLRNAVDAMEGGEERRLTLTAGRNGEGWEIRIRDTGTGIAEAHQFQLFDPFFTTKEVGQGLGLGLSLSYGIVRDFGGTLRAENNPDGGACFVVQLPEAQ
ncbi:two-component system C4-dicarboxylate transport sensor histidine kinase DctB [Azospirillum lipoferum]|uniref:C4-dicarboxylate transport sensor protein DctB n=1 Tax=Azospirillum lipoferum TaxID=193 RepID=A0A5A9GC27_AZOLI|nr:MULTISPECIES: ATP-binding protein [Azospirillum]KAA0591926.1 sensor histidine kinase [Azospirillum lipoferum]MCP1614726.1 two-component system C4-dicarboxylate transport sensor histidine kinase DctB [Azospirillum lipoferum]MDW5537438.1 ATP-binding protein [Azospirillum sp. NL1]